MNRIPRYAINKRILCVIIISSGVLLLLCRWGSLSVVKNLGNVAILHFLLDEAYEEKLDKLTCAQGWVELETQVKPTSVLAASKLQWITSLRERYTAPYFMNPTEATSTFKRGMLNESAGMYERAIADYQRVIDSLDTSSIPAYYGLWRLYDEVGQKPEAEHVAERLHKLVPEYTVEHQHGRLNGWILIGYQLDEMRLELMQPLRIVFYWQAQSAICTGDVVRYWQRPNEEIYCIGDRVYQIRVLENLLPTGEEIRNPRYPSLSGYWPGCSDDQICSQQIMRTQRMGMHTNALVLTNSMSARNALISRNILVEPHTTYVLAGWSKTQHGNPNAWLGVVCFGELWQDGQRYSYIIRNEGIPEWKHSAGVVQMTESERACRVLLLNYGDKEEVYFDDILFGQIRLPSIP